MKRLELVPVVLYNCMKGGDVWASGTTVVQTVAAVGVDWSAYKDAVVEPGGRNK